MLRFEAYSGLYLLHCHNLEHEDAGMMLNFEVTPPPVATLGVQRRLGGVRVTYPSSGSNYVLESTSHLTSPPVWQNVTNIPVVSSNGLTVDLPFHSSADFFRLRIP
jgi:hypothetical protein